MSQPEPPIADLPLDELMSRRRLLLLFAPYRENGSVQWQQQAVSADAGELARRDVTVVTILGEDEGYIDSMPMPPERIPAFREAMGALPNRFTLVLIERGGKELLRRDRPMKMPELFATLDAAAQPEAP